MRAILVGVLVVASTAALFGCPGALEDPGRFDGTSSATVKSCDAPAIMTSRCASCHTGASAAGEVALDSPSALEGLRGKRAISGAGLVIDLGAPERSVLYTKMTSPVSGSVMPPTGKLEEQETSCVREWLQGLAANKGAPAATPPAEAAAPRPTTVALFVAIGHEGRTTISCDDGKSWVANRSDDDAVRCFDPKDCDHDGRPGRGIVFSNGYFVANFGWGEPGTIRRSRDGVAWENVFEGANFTTTAIGNGKIIALSPSPKISVDFGKTWNSGGSPDMGGHSAGFAGGQFLLVEGTSMTKSADGVSWTKLDTVPASCGTNVHGIDETKDHAIVIAGGDGTMCSSSDGGSTWSSKRIASWISSRLTKRGTELLAWGGSLEEPSKPSIFRSSDGITWTSELTKVRGQTSGPPIGAVTASPKGTLVASNDGWQVWYEKQKFYRSDDGLVWDELPSGSFVGSHPIDQILWAEAAPSDACPLPK